MTDKEKLEILVERDKERRFNKEGILFILNFIAAIFMAIAFYNDYSVWYALIFCWNIFAMYMCVKDAKKIVNEE